MDPVDKTFDTVFYWTSKVQNGLKSTTDSAVGAASSLKDYVVDTVSSTVDSVISKGVDPATADEARSRFPNWNIVGLRNLVDSHKSVVIAGGVLTLVIGVGQYHSIMGSRKAKRRRAERLPNGARKDVVLLVGSVSEPLTRYISHDLVNRGFIVYITSTQSSADNKFFANEEYEDVKSLIISSKFQDEGFNRDQIRKFDLLLSSDHVPFQGASPNKLSLVGVVFVPDFYYPTGKFQSISPSMWENSFVQKSLVPLNLLSNGLIALAEKYDSNVIFLTSNVASQLCLPYNAPECITTCVLQEVSLALSRDYPALNVTNLRLGAIAITHNSTCKKSLGIKGDHIRLLHHKLFDLLYSDDNAAVDYVGFGARLLQLCGSWLPKSILQLLYRIGSFH
ncbi:unnamed protein product [Cyberlindnera jadinii]|uniref:DUF1776-domain-containing protein n=1 Tax=Cyberlindnera jadinii (strain ATCC 18201 / CBS 1600 / BCRC 20928 / JCM 3617 / NBRC 0987 / NRRL Y-1542) TaxID=983966 RepID=A0A0H5CBX3_CYBJN|nr:DUF1776-domain-containing protein [Cyberlindnera jadinii NRRL Y-1542]ODV72881.1 DUF1776-domain-containing protein [Cyberlindnera jadinii NRRL Y-1542]CEP22104.1 unnamed protein product [Cyberlindnera jadinii]